MSFFRRIKYRLVHTLKINNTEAQAFIKEGKVEVDGLKINSNVFLNDFSEIKLNGNIIRPATEFIYLKFYKPLGMESTLSKNVENNLSEYFKEYKNLSIAGRLDKNSEGLLLLSNNGKWVENITNPSFEKEKEYMVQMDKEPDNEFIKSFTSGINIGFHITKPCTCEKLENNSIKVVLIEGKNRQIRKMCKALGYEVKHLIRIRIDEHELKDMKVGEVQILKN